MGKKAKFKVGDKVRLSHKYTDAINHKFGSIITRYGEVKNIVFDGKRNIYYVKFKHNAILKPCFADDLDLYTGKYEDTVKEIKTGNTIAERVKENPKYVIGQYVTLTEKVFDDLQLKGILYDKFKVTTDDLRGGFGDTPYQRTKNKIVDKNTRYKIVNIAFDKGIPVYGLDGFGSLYFYEDEIELAHLTDPNEIQKQKNIMVYTCLNVLQSIVENSKKLSCELI